MDCRNLPAADAATAYHHFAGRVIKERVPVSGDIEITRRCNFDCVHCYLGGSKHRPEISARELTTAQWTSIIDEIADAGCLFCLFTGGEPLLRKDFAALYVHARKRGLIVTVFTNGSLIDESIIELFRKYPPNCVEVSIYGTTENTYRAVTRRSGMLEKCLNGVRLLVKAGIQGRMKTILMTVNQHEFEDIRQVAVDFGVTFRFDGMLFPCLDGDRAPTAYRVLPEIVAEKQLATSHMIDEWRDLARRMKQAPESEVLYACGAGATNFHIDPSGRLKPCLMVEDISYDLLTGTFMDGWKNRLPDIKKKKIPLAFACGTCENRAYCGFCPAFFKLETGSETTVSEYLCRIGNRLGRQLNTEKSLDEDADVRKKRTEKAALS